MKNKNLIKTTILAMALVQMGTNGIAPALSGIAAHFSEVNPSMIQYLMTFPSLVVVAVSLLASELSRKIPKKYLTACGCVLSSIGGILAATIHGNFPLLFVWAGIIGVGIGMIVPMIYGLITDFFQGEERASMMGTATSSSNLGSMIMTLMGGLLATRAWNLNYLVYCITLPALILSLLCLPKLKATDVIESGNMTDATSVHDIAETAKDGRQPITGYPRRTTGRFGPYVIESAIFGGLFLFLFNMGPTNLSMLVTEFGLGNATVAGNAATVFLLGGTVMGLLFGKTFQIFREYILTVGAIALAIGFLLISHAPNLGILCIGCFIAGSSISFAMPKCMFTASLGCTPVQATFAMSFVMAVGNLGTFGTPLLTSIASAISGSDSVVPRFTLAIVLAIIIAGFTCLMNLCKSHKHTRK